MRSITIKYFVLAFILTTIGTSAFSQSLNPFSIGTLQPGDSIVIYYDVTINNSCNCTQISNQGTVSGSNFITINTNDPDTGPAGDATITRLNSYPLPAGLTEIKALHKPAGVELSWKVASESQMIKYEVERSSNGRTFTKIGEVMAVNSNGTYSYSFLDQSPNGGVNYYRLRLVELAPSTKYSSIVLVDLSGSSTGIAIYPNPVRAQQIILQLNNLAKGNYQLYLYNTLGRAVFVQNIYHEGGSVSKTITLPAGLAKGVYSVQVRNEKSLNSQLLIVQ